MTANPLIMKIENQAKSIPPLKSGRLNSYSPADIKRWGVERFLDEVCETDPVNIPDLGFTAEENQRMDVIIQLEKVASKNGL